MMSTRQSTGELRLSRPRNPVAPYFFIGAGVLYLALLIGVPLIKDLQLSFTDTKLLNPNGGQFVGADNYADILGNGAFFKSVGTTFVYTFFTVVGSLLIGTVSAVILNRAFPGRTLARAVIVMPWAIPTVALALVFRWMYNDSTGVINQGLAVFGLGTQGWLTDPDYGMVSVLIATIWKVSPFVMLVVLATLQSVPDELYEAARVDGADMYSTFKSIVLPFITPTLRIVALFMTIWSLRRFDIIWLLTGGGPVDATNTIVLSVYREAFENSELGIAAAVGMLGLLISLVVTAVYFLVEARTERRNRVEA